MGFIVYLVMCALGEMAAWLPLSSGFTGYASRFCDPALGFALGYTYWFKYIIVTPNQLTAAALIIQYWKSRDEVNPGVFIAVFWVAIVAINYFGIRFFGEFEFWLSTMKVIVICGVIILSLVLALGGGPDHDRKGFRYWSDPGAFAEYIDDGATGKFLAFWSTMVTATFAYLGTELVGVTVGEAQNPRRTIPRAIKLTFYRIVFFYCISVLLLGMIVP
jgi:yeast amino acid transporter